MSELTTDELLTTTRAVRRRLDFDRPVPLDLVKECLEIALQAPSGSNAQGWEWVVITDPARKAAVGEIYRKAWQWYEKSGIAAGGLHAGDPERSQVQTRVHGSAAYLADRMGEVPVLVIPCLRVPPGGLREGNQAGLWGSILPAAWNYMLAARSRGLGTTLTTLHLMHEQEVADLLGLPEDVRQAALIPTAYYTGTGFKPAPREPLEKVLHIDTW